MSAPGKFTWRMLATVLGGQSLVIFFGALVARGLGPQRGGDLLGLTPFAVMSGLALLAVVAAGLARRPFGPALGWLVQLLTLLSAIWVPGMVLAALLFGLLYGYCHRKGTQIDAEMARHDGGVATG